MGVTSSVTEMCGLILLPGYSTTPDTAIMQKRAKTVLPLVIPMQKRRMINCLSSQECQAEKTMDSSSAED